MDFFTRTIHPDEAGDEALVSRYKTSGNLDLLGSLYQKYVPLVYGVCLKYLKDEETSKDAVMGIFEELVAKVRQHEVKQFRGWLYVLTRNYCLMQLRQEKKRDEVPVDEVMEIDIISHHDTKYSEEYLKILERCMQKLPANQQQSVSLFYLNEKCYKEIAETTGFTLNEVKSYIQNGKRNLKICIEKNSE